MQKYIKLSALFSDGMVMQRDVENNVWGYAEAGEAVKIAMGEFATSVTADRNGFFEVVLPKMQKGGPYVLSVCGERGEVRVRDIMLGDVFLLGGQSNMELPLERCMERYGKDVAQLYTDKIRMFDVPKEFVFGSVREEMEKGCWVKADEENLLAFSAVGFFAAKEILEKEDVPIGLVQTAVGGTPLKAWTSEKTLRALDLDAWELSECVKEGYVESVQATELEREELWRKTAMEADAGENACGTLVVPGLFEEGELNGFYGGLRLTKKIIVPEEFMQIGEPVKLYVGAMLDADVTYINGCKVGETEYRYPPRIYPIADGILHAGENTLTIDMMVFRETGGFMPDMRYELSCGDKTISIEGEWEYHVVRRMAMLPYMTFFQYKAAGLYQGMLYPLRRLKAKACLFYQGESNTGRPETYKEEFEAMVDDWRALFCDPSLSFYQVQLAGFSDGRKYSRGTNWANLREAQRMTQEKPGVYMVQAYDLGEYYELHPTDKRSVGKRLALSMRKNLYQEDVYCEDPLVSEVLWEEDSVLISFAPDSTILCAGGDICGFGLVGEDGQMQAARAVFAGLSAVRVYYDDMQNVQAVTYAWNDCPIGTNVYNQATLPILPFYKKKEV